LKTNLQPMKAAMPGTEEQKAVYLLGIESSGITCGAAISRNGQVLGEVSLNLKNIHSEKLAPLIGDLVSTLRLTTQDLHGIVLSAGPGSFTGLRIGYSIAKGMAAALQIPIVEVPTLDIWAYQAGEQALPVLPVIDAHRGEIFCAIYRWADGQLRQEGNYQLLQPEMLRKFLRKPVVLTGGDAPKLFPTLLPFLPKGSLLLNHPAAYLHPWALLSLGYEKFQRGEFADTAGCEPMYMRAFRGVP